MHDPDLDYLYRQSTLAESMLFVGIGLHSGERATMRVHPAEAGHGITITRRDLPRAQGRFQPRWDHVVNTDRCTTIGNAHGHATATVEHLMSALHGLGISNASIELDGTEFPIMDGSALPFVTAIRSAGIRVQAPPREVIVIHRPVRLQRGVSWAELLPDVVPRISMTIDFMHTDIGIQSFTAPLCPTAYEREIAPARTFGFAEKLAGLRRRGLALGGSTNNAVLLKAGRVSNLADLRFRDEFVRHKALDAIGDLALLGAPILGHYRGHRPGHRINNELLRLLMADTRAWSRVGGDEIRQLTRQDRDDCGPTAGLPDDCRCRETDGRCCAEPLPARGRGTHNDIN